MSALDVQEGGNHYKDMEIQPFEFITRNKIPFAEGCVIKRMCRWRKKAGLEDLRKAIHEIQIMIELEEEAIKRGLEPKDFDANPLRRDAMAPAESEKSCPDVEVSTVLPGQWKRGEWVSVAGGPPQWISYDDGTGCRHG